MTLTRVCRSSVRIRSKAFYKQRNYEERLKPILAHLINNFRIWKRYRTYSFYPLLTGSLKTWPWLLCLEVHKLHLGYLTLINPSRNNLCVEFVTWPSIPSPSPSSTRVCWGNSRGEYSDSYFMISRSRRSANLLTPSNPERWPAKKNPESKDSSRNISSKVKGSV